jgi:hypothetical protein
MIKEIIESLLSKERLRLLFSYDASTIGDLDITDTLHIRDILRAKNLLGASKGILYVHPNCLYDLKVSCQHYHLYDFLEKEKVDLFETKDIYVIEKKEPYLIKIAFNILLNNKLENFWEDQKTQYLVAIVSAAPEIK